MSYPSGGETADPSSPAPRPRWLRQIRNIVLFLAIFAGCCALLGRLAPFPEVQGIAPKWNYLRKHRDRHDLLFVGSSRFYHQIIPAQFDATVAAAGVPVTSFNFGYDAMWPPETYYLLRRLLELKPARLKWVIIDLMDIKTELDDRNRSTLRTAYWHDLRHTALAFREIRTSSRNEGEKRELLIQHGRLCVSRLLNLGRGSDIIERRLAPKQRRKPYSWEHRAGFEPEPESGLEEPERSEFLSRVERLKRLLPPWPVRPVFRDALAEIIRELRTAGIQPIFVIAPTLEARENFVGVPEGAPVFAFNSPTKYPELFDPEKHYDSWHLNEKGAVDFTALLAQHFIAHARSTP